MKIKTVDEFLTDMMNNVVENHWPSYRVLDAWRDFALSLENEIKRLRKEHKAISKGAQTNAEIIKIQAQKMLDQNEKIAKLKEACEAILTDGN